MNEKTGKLGIWLAFEVGALWFTTHVGGGFALGTQEANFYVRFGRSLFYMPLIAMGILGIVLYFSWEYVRLYHIADYKEFFQTLFAPAGRLFSVLFDIAFTILVLLAVGAAMAGFANAVGGLLGGIKVPLWLGYIIAALIVWLLSTFTLKVVLDSSAWMSFGIIAVLVLLMVFRLPHVVSNFAVNALPQTPLFGSAGVSFFQSPVLLMLTYAGLQTCCMGSYISGGTVLKTHKDVVGASIIGWLINGIMLTVMCIVIAGNYPAVIKDPTPTLTIVHEMGSTFPILYSLMLLLALVTTAVSLTYSSAKRWARYGEGAKGRWGDANFRLKIWSIVWIILAWAVANLGIVTIVKKGYGYLGYVGIVVLIVPILIVAPRKVAQKNRELAKAKGQ
jgi:uncharacterized membrane protein YkvI